MRNDAIPQHRKKMVEHFLWLEVHAPEGYAVGALAVYRHDPDCPCPDILKDVKAEKARRAQAEKPSP